MEAPYNYHRVTTIARSRNAESLHNLMDPGYITRLGAVASNTAGQSILTAARHHEAPVFADRLYPVSANALCTTGSLFRTMKIQ